MVAITPTTELQAVNLILRDMGETPVNSLEGNLPLEASQARGTLQETSEGVQTRGWYFNTEIHRLLPNEQGRIRLPRNTLSVTSEGQSRHVPVTSRGGNLYRLTPLDVGDQWDGPMIVKLVVGLPFGDLPPSARRLVALRAARVQQAREVGDDLALRTASADEQAAYAELHAEQLAAEPLTMANDPTVQSIISRRPLHHGGW